MTRTTLCSKDSAAGKEGGSDRLCFFHIFFTYRLLQVCWCFSFTEIQFSVLFFYFFISLSMNGGVCPVPVFGKRLNEIERLNTKLRGDA
jgi:hypothetical protein